MVLNDLLKLEDLKWSLEKYLQVDNSHSQDISDKIKSEILVRYRLNENQFYNLLDRVKQSYIETERIYKP